MPTNQGASPIKIYKRVVLQKSAEVTLSAQLREDDKSVYVDVNMNSSAGNVNVGNGFYTVTYDPSFLTFATEGGCTRGPAMDPNDMLVCNGQVPGTLVIAISCINPLPPMDSGILTTICLDKNAQTVMEGTVIAVDLICNEMMREDAATLVTTQAIGGYLVVGGASAPTNPPATTPAPTESAPATTAPAPTESAPATTAPATTAPAPTESAPATTAPATTAPATTAPATTAPATTAPATTAPATTAPATTAPATTAPATDAPATTAPATDVPATDVPSTGTPTNPPATNPPATNTPTQPTHTPSPTPPGTGDSARTLMVISFVIMGLSALGYVYARRREAQDAE